MAVTRNVAVPSVDFKYAMTIYAKWRSIIAVVIVLIIHSLSDEEDGEDDSSGRLGNSDGEHGHGDGGDDSGKRVATTTVR